MPALRQFGKEAMKKILFFLLVVAVFPLTGKGQAVPYQGGDDNPVRDSIPDRPYVVMDPAVKWLLQAHRELTERQRGIPGFRVQIFMDAGNQARLNTQRSRAEFERKHPGIQAYIVYEEPNFKLRVGDFRTRLDARRYLETIKEDYPAAYIVVSQINFPDL
jgi:hypothetical protein